MACSKLYFDSTTDDKKIIKDSSSANSVQQAEKTEVSEHTNFIVAFFNENGEAIESFVC